MVNENKLLNYKFYGTGEDPNMVLSCLVQTTRQQAIMKVHATDFSSVCVATNGISLSGGCTK